MASARRKRRLPPVRYESKPGRYGTLYRFRITYRDASDRGSPEHTWFTWAYNAESATDRFEESDDGGWEIMSVERVRDRS